jgi:hypothetical protein
MFFNILAFALLLPLGLVNCTSRAVSSGKPPGLFPPQVLLEHGDYSRFVVDNQQALAQCTEAAVCATALFNLGFVHAYPSSPLYDATRALQYLHTLHARYPQTPWAVQGQVWSAFIHDKLALEEAQRRLQATLHTLQTDVQTLHTDLQALQAGLRAREATIRSLQARLKRSRDIDLRIEKKERELLR